MTCPICQSETVQKYRPFCSRRCADIDLGRWMTGSFAIASEEPVDEDDLISERSESVPPKHH